MIPFFFYNGFKERISFDLNEEFAQPLPWSEILGIINQKWLMERKKLTRTEVLICKVLSRYNTKNQIFHFPITTNMIANRSRQSLSIIEKSFPTLYERNIASELFLINSWKLGWEQYLLLYSYEYDNE